MLDIDEGCLPCTVTAGPPEWISRARSSRTSPESQSLIIIIIIRIMSHQSEEICQSLVGRTCRYVYVEAQSV
jgi:hypothetical protein